MILHDDIVNFRIRNPVVTVGIFDGVHRGHRYILDRLLKAAREHEGKAVLLTLWPHPRTVLNQADGGFKLLTTMDEKKAILEESGLDHLVILPFTREFSRLSSCDFIQEYLVEKIGIKHLVVGYNHRFGRDREGDFRKLKECAGRFGFGIEKVPPLQSGQGDISSSGIRRYLMSGEVSRANESLGWNYTLQGEVVGGSRLGRSMGFPTANITPESDYKLIPAKGVYAVEASLKGDTYRGMLNIGTRPTVNDDISRLSIEVHLLDFQNNIYSEQILIRFIARVRDEIKFGDITALKKQLMDDRDTVTRLFRSRDEQNSV